MVDIVSVVNNKYSDCDCNFPNIRICNSPRKTESGRIRLPPSISLDDENIESLGNLEELQEISQDLETLHLNNNNLTDWNEIFNLIRISPKLTSLNLSNNPLSNDANLLEMVNFDSKTKETESNFKNLKTLVLNGTQCNWKTLTDLLQILPRIEELHFSFIKNDTTNEDDVTSESFYNSRQLLSITQPFSAKSFPQIRKFYYNSNQVDCPSILKLIGSLFPGLQSLFLVDNNLTSLVCKKNVTQVENTEESLNESFDQKKNTIDWAKVFPDLQAFYLTNNQLDDWQSIDALCEFPKLTDVKVSNQPIFNEMKDEEIRHHLIARLPTIKRLNGTLIEEDERAFSERNFIRYWMQKPEEQRPVRFESLEEMHGAVEPYPDVNLSLNSIVRVSVMLHNKTLPYDLNLKQNVETVRKDMCRLMGIEPSTERRPVQLLYWDKETYELRGPQLIKSKILSIHSFKVADGDWFSLEI